MKTLNRIVGLVVAVALIATSVVLMDAGRVAAVGGPELLE